MTCNPSAPLLQKGLLQEHKWQLSVDLLGIYSNWIKLKKHQPDISMGIAMDPACFYSFMS